jgi:hypothetical protein
MDYSVHMLARSEHELMVKSLPTVPDFANPFPPEPPRWVRLLAKLRVIGAQLRPSPRKQPSPIRPTLTMSSPSAFLREQIQDDSNRELDWLWAASQVTHPEEIRYCLERVLYINPMNRDAQHTLSNWVAPRAADEALAVNSSRFVQDAKR